MHQLFSAVIYSLVGALTPGPNNLMLMSAGMNFDIRACWQHYVGVVLGVTFVMLCVGFGIGTLFDQYHWLKPTLKVLGASYMLYLAWKISQSSKKAKPKNINQPITFIQAVAIQWVNVKVVVLGISANSLFTLTHDHIMNGVWLALITMGASAIGSAVWLLLGKYLHRILKTEKHQQVFNYVMGLLLSFSILLILLE